MHLRNLEWILPVLLVPALSSQPHAQFGGGPDPVLLDDHVSHAGFRWDFDDDYPVGQYANGDWWVQGPVTITSITPAAEQVGEWWKNGTHVNPDARSAEQGLDNTLYTHGGFSSSYVHAMNIGASIAGDTPYYAHPGESIVSCLSATSAAQRPQLRAVEVLTVVDEVPATGTFRPPYTGTDKSLAYTKSDIDMSKLPALAVPAGVEAPSWAFTRALVDGVWYEAPGVEFLKRYSRPSDHVADYGRDVQEQLYLAAVRTMLTGTNAQKSSTVTGLVQIGLDRYAMAVQDPWDNEDNPRGHWNETAGHGCGAKFAIYYAGWLLDDMDMIDAALPAASQGTEVFQGYQEDEQVFYVATTEGGQVNFGVCGYGTGGTGWIPLDTPEWGIDHYRDIREGNLPPSDDAHWWSTDTVAGCQAVGCNPTCNVEYRTCCTANVWWSENLMSRIIVDEDPSVDFLFRPEFYDYQVRYLDEQIAHEASANTIFWQTLHSNLLREFWETYDEDYPGP